MRVRDVRFNPPQRDVGSERPLLLRNSKPLQKWLQANVDALQFRGRPLNPGPNNAGESGTAEGAKPLHAHAKGAPLRGHPGQPGAARFERGLNDIPEKGQREVKVFRGDPGHADLRPRTRLLGQDKVGANGFGDFDGDETAEGFVIHG